MAEIMVFSKRVGCCYKKKTPGCRRVGVAVIGFEVPMRIFTWFLLNGMSDINFANPKLKLTQRTIGCDCKKINSNLM